MFAKFFIAQFLQVSLLLAAINAELLPETKNSSEYNVTSHTYSIEDAKTPTQHDESSNLKINNSSTPRDARQAPSPFGSKQPGFATSFLNRLNTHGIAITGNIGVGVRYASGNNYNVDGSPPNQNQYENTNNVYDRYLGTTFNVGTNLHLLNKNDDQTSYNNGAITQKYDTGKELKYDNSTIRNTLWKRLNQYFSKSKSPDAFNGTIIDCGETDERENCTELISNPNMITKLMNKYFNKNEPRTTPNNDTESEIHSYSLHNATHEGGVEYNNTNLFQKINKYFHRYKFPAIVEQIWNDRNNIFPHNDSSSIKDDYNTFRSTVRDFLMDKISSYISQNTTYENLVQKFVKRALLYIVADYQTTDETKEHLPSEKTAMLKYLNVYFSNERFKNFFPDIENIRNNLTNSQLFDFEGYANGWLKNNLSHLFSKFSSGNATRNHT